MSNNKNSVGAKASCCPFCQSDNRCLMASPENTREQSSPADTQAECWCMTIEVPTILQELARQKSFDQQCICMRCVQAYAVDREEFLKRL